MANSLSPVGLNGNAEVIVDCDWSVLSRWAASWGVLFLGAIAALGLTHCVRQMKEPPSSDKASQALVGKWKAKGEDGFDDIRTIIFEPDGEAWLITTVD